MTINAATPVQDYASDLYDHLVDLVNALDGAYTDPTITAAKELLDRIDATSEEAS